MSGAGRIIILLCILTILDQINARPSGGRGAPGSRPRKSKAPKKVVSPAIKAHLSEKMRLGTNTAGILDNYSVESRFQLSSLQNSPSAPVEYVKASPQLDGNMGNSQAPRRLSSRKQYKVKSFTAPDKTLLGAPGRLTTLSEEERLEIATNFWVTLNYTFHQLSTPSQLTERMQRNYGLEVTGILDDATITAMTQPRCGVPDGPAEYRTFPNREHWTDFDVTYKINGYTPDMSQCQVRNAFKRAFRVWEEVTDLTFTKTDSDDADIIIYFGYEEHGDGYPFDGANGLLAHAFTPGTEPLNGDSHFDEGEFWTLGKGRVFDTYNGNGGGKPCSFPFFYEDKQYEACTSIGRDDGLQWCATTPDYDRDREWAYCPHESLFTYGGNAENDPCQFPFSFLGNTYDSCTHEGRSDGYKWCATTNNYDANKRWGFCPDRAHGTEGGNANGDSCVFPFTFQSNIYNECTTQGRSDYKLWCSTTANYDEDGRYGFCNQEGYSLFLVATHEFGHAIGLDHSNVPGALMYPVYSYHADFVLPDDDIRGAQDLYGGPRTRTLPPLRLETCGGDLTETETTRPPSTRSTKRPRTTRPTRRTRTTRPTRRTRTTRPTRRPRTTEPTTTDRCDTNVTPTNICERPIDATMRIQDEVFIFQGAWVWRMKEKRTIDKEPLLSSKYWRDVGCGITAAYQRENGNVVIFKGTKVYKYDGTTIVSSYPRDVTDLGLPSRTMVDGVIFMETKNKRTKEKENRLYYFSREKVYRADVETEKVLRGAEPTTLGLTRAWKDLPPGIDAVYRESMHKPYTIFIKGSRYYRYENNKGKVDFSRNTRKLFPCSLPDEEVVALPLRERETKRKGRARP